MGKYAPKIEGTEIRFVTLGGPNHTLTRPLLPVAIENLTEGEFALLNQTAPRELELPEYHPSANCLPIRTQPCKFIYDGEKKSGIFEVAGKRIEQPTDILTPQVYDNLTSAIEQLTTSLNRHRASA